MPLAVTFFLYVIPSKSFQERLIIHALNRIASYFQLIGRYFDRALKVELLTER